MTWGRPESLQTSTLTTYFLPTVAHLMQTVFGCDSKKANFSTSQQEIRPNQVKRFTNAAKEN